MNDNNNPPIVVPATPASDQIAAALRVAVLLISTCTALAGFVSTRNLIGFIAYAQSSQFLAAVAIVTSAATFVWGQWKTRHRSVQLATIAGDPRVPDAVASVAPGASR